MPTIINWRHGKTGGNWTTTLLVSHLEFWLFETSENRITYYYTQNHWFKAFQTSNVIMWLLLDNWRYYYRCMCSGPWEYHMHWGDALVAMEDWLYHNHLQSLYVANLNDSHLDGPGMKQKGKGACRSKKILPREESHHHMDGGWKGNNFYWVPGPISVLTTSITTTA
jgi:hypothetical protein